MDSASLEINARVKLQYEAYPYPDYSLFIPLRTQEAYASHSLFAAQLLKEKGRVAPVKLQKDTKILVAGSGDILPFVLSFWEPQSHPIYAIDIAEKNIQRARFRSFLRPHSFFWQVGNLENKASKLPEGVGHVDSYGVLHHLANPKQTLERLYEHMLPGATMRIMVYNSGARSWIRHVQKAFTVLGLSAFDRNDLDTGLKILTELSRKSPLFRERLNPMKASIFHHSARFVDTFFHAREARLSIGFWLESLASVGFETIGLYDRYAELDDLKNPLLSFPTLRELQSRVGDRRFENNFEIFVTKKAALDAAPAPMIRNVFPTRWRLRMPPKAWFTYMETNSIPMSLRFKLWHSFLKTTSGDSPILDPLFPRLAPEAWQRLARLGAVFPSNFSSPAIRDLLLKPMHATMDQPTFPDAVDLRVDAGLRQLLTEVIARKHKDKASIKIDRVLEQTFRRLEAAQKP